MSQPGFPVSRRPLLAAGALLLAGAAPGFFAWCFCFGFGRVFVAALGVFEPLPVDLNAAITSAVTIAIAASAMTTTRDSTLRCWRVVTEARRSGGSSSPMT